MQSFYPGLSGCFGVGDSLRRSAPPGALKPVFHGGYDTLTLKELVRNYLTLVDDATHEAAYQSAVPRAWHSNPGTVVFRADQRRSWLEQLPSPGARIRAEHLLTGLDTMTTLRRRAKLAMVGEAQQRSGWNVFRSIPLLEPVRISCILAIIVTPHHFRTNASYARIVVTRSSRESSGEQQVVDGVLDRRRHVVATRVLNRNYNRGCCAELAPTSRSHLWLPKRRRSSRPEVHCHLRTQEGSKLLIIHVPVLRTKFRDSRSTATITTRSFSTSMCALCPTRGYGCAMISIMSRVIRFC